MNYSLGTVRSAVAAFWRLDVSLTPTTGYKASCCASSLARAARYLPLSEFPLSRTRPVVGNSAVEITFFVEQLAGHRIEAQALMPTHFQNHRNYCPYA